MRRGGKKRNIKIACEVKYKHKAVTCEELHTENAHRTIQPLRSTNNMESLFLIGNVF